MEEQTENKLEKVPVKKLIWQMGLPMIFSMVAQALYNIVDTAFVINMPVHGNEANLALTYAFPVQIFMIAIGVGLGIGINALISSSLGKRDEEKATLAMGNGITLAIIFYLVFLIFGIFLSKPFISMQAQSIADEETRNIVIEYGTTYLTICCTLSIGQMLYTVYERFLQATGRTMLSTIGQLSGAIFNIVFDYVFIYPCDMGVAGAALATVMGQFLSFILDAIFHYWKDKELKNTIKSLIPKKSILKEIFIIGIPAMIMQALLSIMMLGVNLILGTSQYQRVLLMNSFGIYYKVQQVSLFACFGMSNALISIVSFHYGRGNKKETNDAMKWGIIDSVIVALVITALFEILASLIAKLFGLASGEGSDEIVNMTTLAIRIASIGFVFMALSVSIQGLLQGMREVFSPLIISLLRLVVFAFPLVILFIQFEATASYFWFAFPISELLTAFASFYLLFRAKKKKVNIMENKAEESM